MILESLCYFLFSGFVFLQVTIKQTGTSEIICVD
ncbi:unnamed protein product [Brassica rapa subsp. narinosa]|uniref:(rape) hypothetical protein n=1 Tax=Brassica napus TaxID=3708 RepID=A0A816XEB3_BRANA|nr:unnamed protein product [Brassica napus]